MTEPAEKATLRPLFSPVRQALAVRAFAAVAIFMPMKPERPEKNPPVIKAKGTKGVSSPTIDITPKITNNTAKKIATMVYCLFRYAFAPERMEAEIFFIFSVPSSKLKTRFAMISAKPSANREPTKTAITRYNSICSTSPFITICRS